MQKEPRHAALIVTPEGILMGKDKNDKYIQETIDRIENDPNKNDAQKAQAVEIVRSGKYSLIGGKRELQDKNGIDTIIREIDEELNLLVEPYDVLEVLRIRGRTRQHIIYLVRASGMIHLNPEESITGIGFLKDKNVFPLSHHFFQSHVPRVRKRFYDPNRSQKRETTERLYLSSIRVSQKLTDEWTIDESKAYLYRGSNNKNGEPRPIQSSPNFTIFDAEGKPTLSHNSLGYLHAISDPNREYPRLAKAGRRPPSNPKMPAVVVAADEEPDSAPPISDVNPTTQNANDPVSRQRKRG